MSNNNHVIEQIISQADIVKIIGKHTELKRSGNEFKGNCPFHGEKTPSFYVNPQKGLYKCFGCGVGGNALTFLKEYENMTAGEALRELSRQTGIELPKERPNQAHIYKKTPRSSSPTQSQHPQTQNLSNRTENTVSTSAQPQTPNQQLNQPSSKKSGQNLDQDNQVISNQNPVSPSFAAQDFDGYYADTDGFLDKGYLDKGFSDNGVSVDFPPAYFATADISFDTLANVNYSNENGGDNASNSANLSTSSSPFSTPTQQSGNLYDLLTQICQFYQHQLTQSPQAQQYFSQRGLTDSTISEFALGYAPTGWQHLEQAFPHDIEGLKILGLVRTSQNGRSFDLLRHRVIFPIRDGRGRVVGFAGRALSDEDMPKYINSSDSPVFHKQQVLYGLYEGRKAKAEKFLVVEGYMDVISLHQAGVYGAVAAMGTALATSQIEKLLQYHPVLTLSFDGDRAGQKAAWRALETALPALYDGKEVRFLTLPAEHDPDSYVKAHGATAMQTQIDNATPLSEYVFSTLSRRIPITTAEGRGKLLAELNLLIQKLPKGSYGWLLREDIRSRMGLGKRQQAQATQDALLNFDGALTPLLQLQLCFLFQPLILGAIEAGKDGLNNQLIDTVFELSGANAVKFSKKTPVPPDTVSPLAWEDIVDGDTLELIKLIQHNQNSLSEFSSTMQNLPIYELINAKAHFLLVSMSPQKRERLVGQWAIFLRELAEREIMDVSDLVMENLIKLVLDGLQKRLKQQKSIASLQYIKNQSQAIFAWQKAWLEKRDNN